MARSSYTCNELGSSVRLHRLMPIPQCSCTSLDPKPHCTQHQAIQHTHQSAEFMMRASWERSWSTRPPLNCSAGGAGQRKALNKGCLPFCMGLPCAFQQFRNATLLPSLPTCWLMRSQSSRLVVQPRLVVLGSSMLMKLLQDS